MLHNLESRMKMVADNPHAKVFGGKDAIRGVYPYGVQRVNDDFESFRETCYDLIVRPERDDGIINKELVQYAEEAQADYIIPKYYHNDREATRESVKNFLHWYQEGDHQCHATPIIPLQPSYTDEYWENRKFYDQFDHFLLAGMGQFDSDVSVDKVFEFNRQVGWENKIHLHNVSPDIDFITSLRDKPRLLTSIDCSHITSGFTPTEDVFQKWEQTKFSMPNTSGINTKQAGAITFLQMVNYLLSHHVNDEEVEREYESNTFLPELLNSDQCLENISS